jgi:parallel beta-helix repeat protein
MKRALTILSIILLAGIFLYACGIIPNVNTSIVTIKIGDAPNRAVLKAEAATPWTRAKHLLTEIDLVPAAEAYIPSVVQAIVVTVTAPDISMPIVAVKSIKDTDTSTVIRIDVPNGTARKFLVEGYRGVDSQVYYSGTAAADLTGTEVTLPVTMGLVGPGIYVDFTNGNDTSGTGTSANPYKTITKALSTTTGTSAIFVAAGTYPPDGASAGENYPLQLQPSTAIVCTGANFTTILDLGSLSTTAVYGNDRASVDNCGFRVINFGGAGVAINDAIAGQPGQQSRVRINGAFIEIGGNPTGAPNIGVVFNDDSLLLETVLTGSAAGGSLAGVQVRGGKPSIIGNTISLLPYGIDLASGAGDALITANIVDSNSAVGIRVNTSGKPTISLNTISNGSTGILVNAGTPVITGNDINNNSWGIDVETGAGNPVIQGNSIYCSAVADFFTNVSTTLDIRGNAWDHDLTTVPSGTYGPTDMISFNGPFGCSSGVDICYQDFSPQPNYTSNLSAVPNGCLIPLGKPLL